MSITLLQRRNPCSNPSLLLGQLATQAANGLSSWQSVDIEVRAVAREPLWPVFGHLCRLNNLIIHPILLNESNCGLLCRKVHLARYSFQGIGSRGPSHQWVYPFPLCVERNLPCWGTTCNEIGLMMSNE